MDLGPNLSHRLNPNLRSPLLRRNENRPFWQPRIPFRLNSQRHRPRHEQVQPTLDILFATVRKIRIRIREIFIFWQRTYTPDQNCLLRRLGRRNLGSC